MISQLSSCSPNSWRNCRETRSRASEQTDSSQRSTAVDAMLIGHPSQPHFKHEDRPEFQSAIAPASAALFKQRPNHARIKVLTTTAVSQHAIDEQRRERPGEPSLQRDLKTGLLAFASPLGNDCRDGLLEDVFLTASSTVFQSDRKRGDKLGKICDPAAAAVLLGYGPLSCDQL